MTNAEPLGTKPIDPPESVRRITAEAEPPKYVFVYYFEDGGVGRIVDTKPDSILFEQAYVVTVSVPRKHNQAPYVEIIKMANGPGSVILTANVPVSQEEQSHG